MYSSDGEVCETMIKMFKFELLFFTMIAVQSLCSAIEFPKILHEKESFIDYEKRMYLKGFPCVGDLYNEAYKTKMKSNNMISPDDYKLFIGSVPRIKETFESLTNRTIKMSRKNPNIQGLHFFSNDELMRIIYNRYPQLYESYQEYSDRMKKNGYEAFSHSMFKGLKYLFPTIGEIYSQYTLRMTNSVLPEFTEDEFNSYIELFPKIGESRSEYMIRSLENKTKNIDARKINLWIPMKFEDYDGLKRLYSFHNETYDSYKNRIVELDIFPMPMEAFNRFKLVSKLFKLW